jgi:hypothetical protein
LRNLRRPHGAPGKLVDVEFITANVLVRPENLPKLLRYAAQLEEEATGGRSVENDDDRTRRWDPESVRESYLGGKSIVWRPFLEYLAERPDQWVPWADLVEAIERTPQEASGVLGAAERRCHQLPPYEKRGSSPAVEFRMPGRVASVIRRHAHPSDR